jgi:competence protein ComEA
VASAAWWLLRAPAPPVEARLPVASAAASSGTPSVPASAAPAASASGDGNDGAASPAAAASSDGAGPPTTTMSTLVVQAAGAVTRPGVYRLPAGARVTDLIVQAGGPSAGADLDVVPLAAPLADGQRVYVPVAGEAVPPVVGAVGPASPAQGAVQGATGGPSGEQAGPVNLNTATADELDELPGVGPSTAAAIIAHRDEHGPFGTVEELLDVRGIGPARLDELRSLVTV